jgi:hypothetical protein
MPEHMNMRYYGYSAPYRELRGGWTATPPLARAIYPDAFSLINTADGHPEVHRRELLNAVRHGDILMYRSWFRDPGNDAVKAIMAESRESNRR